MLQALTFLGRNWELAVYSTIEAAHSSSQAAYCPKLYDAIKRVIGRTSPLLNVFPQFQI